MPSLFIYSYFPATASPALLLLTTRAPPGGSHGAVVKVREGAVYLHNGIYQKASTCAHTHAYTKQQINTQ